MATVAFKANPGSQYQFMKDFSVRYTAYEGGWSSGKSWAGSRKLALVHCHNNQQHLVPSAVLAPTYQQLKDVCLVKLRETFDEIGIACRWIESEKLLTFPGINAAPMMFRSADKPEMITGWEIGAFWGDEVARWKSDRSNPVKDPLTQIKGRLRHPQAKVLIGIYTYTNEGDATRIYEEMHNGRQDRRLYTGSTKENPAMLDFYEQMKSELTEEQAQQYLYGGAMSLGGANVYSSFSMDNVAEVELVPHQPIAFCVDFNIEPGMHAYIGQFYDDKFHVVHEIHEKRMSVIACVNYFAAIMARYPWAKDSNLLIYGDATGKSEWAGTSDSCYTILDQALEGHGVKRDNLRYYVPQSNPFVTDRVNAVNASLCNMRDERKMVINPRCKRLIDDFRKVKWDEKGREIDKKSDQDLTHASDAIGYWVAMERPIRRETSTQSNRGRFNVRVR